jgi:2-polyprenyl-3-methyl-5-hydroxy-6-metoxy-1,4-benzoquinol methylase
VQKSIELLKEYNTYNSIADLSAGDAAIIYSIDAGVKYIGDYAPGYAITGHIDETINYLPEVDLFICSETLEHLDDPDATLKAIRKKTKYLFISTPNAEDDNNNPEHYWGWNNEDMKQMLIDAGFDPVLYYLLELKEKYHYDFQMWICK